MLLHSITLIIFFISAGVLLAYWILILSKLAFYQKPKQKEIRQIPVSIVIAARNESHNLQANLPKILNQDYPAYEVIVVDDGSTDGTADTIHRLSLSHKDLRTFKKEKSQGNKKQALSMGIAQARYGLLLLTDADCVPKGNQWLSGMVVANQSQMMTLGYGPLKPSNGLVNIFSRFETAMTAIQYFSWAILGVPYMGVGRNLMYRKELIDQTNGFRSHEDLRSGDDDLFVQEAGVNNQTTVALDPQTFMYSESKKTWSAFLKQKRRHISTSVRYRLVHKLALALFAAAQICLYPSAILALIFRPTPDVWFFLILVILMRWALFYGAAKKLNEYRLFPWFLPLDILYSVYLCALLPSLIFGGKIEWKQS